jgi:hypothetical protein
MKKTILLFLTVAFLSNIVSSQITAPGSTPAPSCTCNPNGFNPFVVTIAGVTTTVRCGHQFSLNCNAPIKINSGYKCVPVGTSTCVVKFTAVLKNAAGVVIQNYPAFTFPWVYSFAAAGNYSLEITPICGGIKCPPCRFFFTVTCPPPTTACDCKVDGWQPFIATIGNNAPMTVNCGHQFGVHKGNPIKLIGKYICKGDCVTKYSAVLKNNVTGAIVQNYPVFTFPWTYTFAVGGNYKLEITPICGNKKCQPCVFYFTVD